MVDRLKELRKVLKLSQAAFAEKIGLKQSAIGDIESGKNNLNTRNLNAICREFNVNSEWLKTGEGEMFLPSSSLERLAREYELTADETALIKNFVQLPAEDRAAILKLVKNFARDTLNVPLPEERKPDDELTAEEKRRIMNEELDAEAAGEKEGQKSFLSTGTNGIRKSRKLSR